VSPVSTLIVNASPLILLGKIGRLELLTALAGALVVPHAVAVEIALGPDHDPARIWLTSHGRTWVAEAAPNDPRIMAWDLGAGETGLAECKNPETMK